MNNIILIGMMGSGKSTLGHALANELSYKFFDTDQAIENKTGMTITSIFDKYGEDCFRQMESDLCQEIGLHNYIISTGGGIILNPSNVDALKKLGKIVYLQADVETLVSRLMMQTHNRPLLSQSKLKNQLEDLLEKRAVLYEGAADVTVDISHYGIDELIKEIIKKLNE
jgi:shikimate kinase